MVQSPIQNKIKTVFIPVKNIEKAKAWYSKILGIQDGEIRFEHLYVAEMEGVGMVLDTMPMWRKDHGDVSPMNVPTIQFGTDDIHASYQFMIENGVELVTGIEYEQFFVFKDPDGNMLMVCQN